VHPSILVPLAVAVAALAGVSLARISSVPAPVFYVLAGLAVAYTPGIQDYQLPPHVVFYGFLPPLLYHAAFFTSPRETRAQVLPILTLALGLVLATMLAVGWAAAAAIGVLGAGAGFVLGAVLGPTDPVAATALIRNLDTPERLQAVIEGESLVNDGIGLVAFSIAVASATEGGGFSVPHALVDFIQLAGGGVAFGLVVGWIVEHVRRRVHDAEIDILISLLTPYAAYIPAERMHVSGVLATVACGVYLGWHAGGIFKPQVRLQSTAFWDVLNFLLTAGLFVLLGMQFPSVVGALGQYSPWRLVWWAVLTAGVVVGVRMLWMFTVPYIASALTRSRSWREVSPSRDRIVLGWSGMRGALSLAAALSISAAVPHRELLLFLTFTTILAGLLVQGTSLPWLLRALGFERAEEMGLAEAEARLRLVRVAIERLDELYEEDWAPPEFVAAVRQLYEQREERLRGRVDPERETEWDEGSYPRLRGEVIAAQRRLLAELGHRGELSVAAARKIERELDLEEVRIRG
jgi:monovalent cation/hydrogen antiporter